MSTWSVSKTETTSSQQWLQSPTFYARRGKRVLDIAISAMALPFVGLVGLVVGAAIKFEDGGPVLFRQERRGLYGRTFSMLKFRSMTVNAPDLRNYDSSTLASAEDFRVTRVGRIIRRTSIDELPQLLNVLTGDMSLVGPRPNLTTTPLALLKGNERLRLSVQPGMTGFNQAYFRNSSTLTDRYAADCQYAGNITFRNDLQIILKTLASVPKARNIYATGKH